MQMPDSQAVKLLSTPMVDGEVTEEEPSQERTQPRLIEVPLMLLDGLPNHSSPTNFAQES